MSRGHGVTGSRGHWTTRSVPVGDPINFTVKSDLKSTCRKNVFPRWFCCKSMLAAVFCRLFIAPPSSPTPPPSTQGRRTSLPHYEPSVRASHGFSGYQQQSPNSQILPRLLQHCLCVSVCECVLLCVSGCVSGFNCDGCRCGFTSSGCRINAAVYVTLMLNASVSGKFKRRNQNMKEEK